MAVEMSWSGLICVAQGKRGTKELEGSGVAGEITLWSRPLHWQTGMSAHGPCWLEPVFWLLPIAECPALGFPVAASSQGTAPCAPFWYL